MAEIFTVETRGVGKPDYSKEISLGEVRPGVTLKYNQAFVIGGLTFSPLASPYPWVKSPLAAGDSAHIVEWSSGQALPYNLAAGYIMSIIQVTHSMSEDIRTRIYIDTIFFAYLGTSGGGRQEMFSDIAKMSSAIFDPTAASGHTIDIIVENLGTGDMAGSITFWTILEAVGTPPLPRNKTVKCKFCAHTWVVPRETTAIECPKCGLLNIYVDLTKLRRL